MYVEGGFCPVAKKKFIRKTQFFEFFSLFGNIQASYRQVFGCYIHEVDFPVCLCGLSPLFSRRDCYFAMECSSSCSACRTCLSHFMRHIHNIFSYTCGAETYQAHACEHVQLCAAHHSHCNQHRFRHGDAYVAKGACCNNGFRWCGCRKL